MLSRDSHGSKPDVKHRLYNLIRMLFYHPTKFGWPTFKTGEMYSEHTDIHKVIFIYKIYSAVYSAKTNGIRNKYSELISKKFSPRASG